MKRRFNTTGICIPEKHYMVDLNSRLRQIRALVDEGAYFTINRARQYGKTTTLHALGAFLAKDYLVVSLDFQALGAGSFHDESTFSQTFAAYFLREFGQLEYGQEEAVDQSLERLRTVARHKGEKFLLFDLFDCLIQLCAVTPKPIVLMIDEADSAANNQVFLDFLAQLRNYYLARDMGRVSTFQSVILAGVYDVRNLKRKIRTEDDHKSNSPWNTHAGNEENGSLLTFDDCPWDYREPVPYNIAADFEVVMSFSVKDIEGMLAVYEKDHQTGMDVRQMAELIFADTAGYPFLVSRLCKLMDEKVAAKKAARRHGQRRDFWRRSECFSQRKIHCLIL